MLNIFKKETYFLFFGKFLMAEGILDFSWTSGGMRGNS
jgi:hypothetical protein